MSPRVRSPVDRVPSPIWKESLPVPSPSCLIVHSSTPLLSPQGQPCPSTVLGGLVIQGEPVVAHTPWGLYSSWGVGGGETEQAKRWLSGEVGWPGGHSIKGALDRIQDNWEPEVSPQVHWEVTGNAGRKGKNYSYFHMENSPMEQEWLTKPFSTTPGPGSSVTWDTGYTIWTKSDSLQKHLDGGERASDVKSQVVLASTTRQCDPSA